MSSSGRQSRTSCPQSPCGNALHTDNRWMALHRPPAAVAIALVACAGLVSACGTTRTTGASRDHAAQAKLAQLPHAFEANGGQTDPQVGYLARGAGYTLFLIDRGN